MININKADQSSIYFLEVDFVKMMIWYWFAKSNLWIHFEEIIW